MAWDPGAPFSIVHGAGPLVASAIHAGHALRPGLEERMSLSAAERRREEDPFTDVWTRMAPTRIVAHRSRFEVDLNRPRTTCVYLEPEDAWGLQVWKERPSDLVIRDSRDEYDAFYHEVGDLLTDKADQYGKFVVYDLHSYNHRRAGPDSRPADPARNPEVNVGTGSMDRGRWGAVVDRLISDLQSVEVAGRTLDVRENVKFKGGEFSRWTHQTFPDSGCAIALEFKKFFMDEWAGVPLDDVIGSIGRALRVVSAGTLEVLDAL